MTITTVRPLQRILGTGFGLVMVLGNTVGVGILRLPGTVAAALGDRALILVAWALGGLYALMGAVAVAELSAALPEAGGFRVYARRAFGDGAGFVVGWIDWLGCVATIAYVAVTAVAFLGTLWSPANLYPRAGSILILTAFTAIHWIGLRIGSSITAAISVAGGMTLMVLVAGCSFAAPVSGTAAMPLATSAASLPIASVAMVFAMVPALRAVLTAYDGWYAPIYMAEENVDPGRALPRAIIGGTVLVVTLYVLVNVALLRVLPLSVLAAADLPAAEAARLILPRGGAELVTVISVLTVLSVMNNNLLMAPRVLLSIGRDGLFTERAAVVSVGGTPRMGLALTGIIVVALILTSSFEQIIALYAVLFLLLYLSAFLAIFILRRKESRLPRPFRALGYPLSSAIVLMGSIAFLIAAIAEDPRSGLIAVMFVACCLPAYVWMARNRRLRLAEQPV